MNPSLRQPKKNVIIALHDVAPCFEEELRAAVSALKNVGVASCALFVIPHHHCQQSLEDAPHFVSWLHELVRTGSEVMLHGYYHLQVRKSSSLLHRVMTAGEGEFAVLRHDEALELINAGQAMLERLGFSPPGFIPPAWLLNDAAKRALRQTPLLFSEDHFSVWSIHQQRRVFSPAISYVQRSRLRRRVALRTNPGMLAAALHAPLLRIAIHPCDIRDAKTFAQILDLIHRHRLGERTTSYRALFADLASSPRAEDR